MLPQSKRLNLKTDFKWVVTGKKIETKFTKLFIKFSENLWPKVGIAVSAGVFKKANQRNKAKRLVYSAFESLYNLLPKNINIVALPKEDINKVKSTEVLLDLQQSLKYEKIIN